MNAAERLGDRAPGAVTGLEQIYLLNREGLLRFLRARGAGEDAEDLLQELWIRAAAANGPVRHPLSYLYRIADNLILDRRRVQLSRARRDHAWAGGEEAKTDIAASEPNGEQAAIARSELEVTRASLRALGGRTETILRRFRLDGASQQQIARELGISLSAVEKHLQKAYRSLLDLRRRLDAD